MDMDRIESRIDKLWSSDPSSKALWWQGEWISRSSMLDWSGKNEAVLRAAGFRKGHRLVTLLPNCPAFLALALSVWRLGGTVVPLNHRSGSELMDPTLKLLDPFSVIWSEGDEITEKLAGAYAGGPVPLAGALSSLNSRLHSEAGSRDTAVMFTTSGTTGFPKAVPLTHGNMIDNADRSWEVLKLTHEDRILWALPSFHSFGFTLGGLMGPLHGAPQAVVPSFMPPAETLEAIVSAGATVLFFVPAMVEFLKRAVRHGGPRPTAVRMVVTGGDRLNLGLDKASVECFGVPILEGYGTTECSPVVAVNSHYGARKLGTIGTVLPGYSWEIRSESGKALGPGEDGILWVRGPSVFSGYYKDPKATAERLKDGWYDTGDVVRCDSDGYITVLDRVSDLIIIGGFNVYPQEVETVLNRHPSVTQSAVVAYPHPVQGQIGRAFIVLKEGASLPPREIIDFCKGKLAHYKIPRKIDFLESLPMSPSGKILRRELRNRP